MMRLAIAALAAVAVALFALDASAGKKKKCPDGYRYDKATKMCWPVRGSY